MSQKVSTSSGLVSRLIREAEGYLELGLPAQAARALVKRLDQVNESPRASYLLGEALREMECYAEAVHPLERSRELAPDDLHTHLALAWCYKRTRRLSDAIDTLQEALRTEPFEAILHYNLACYWSLARQRKQALRSLSRALDLDVNYLDLIPSESDFDPIRDDPEFQLITSVIV
jgi:tetratricopeptide (TPR) repeat protein